jgi:hypothetical protein
MQNSKKWFEWKRLKQKSIFCFEAKRLKRKSEKSKGKKAKGTKAKFFFSFAKKQAKIKRNNMCFTSFRFEAKS